MSFAQSLIRVEPNIVVFPPTYISNTSRLTVKITNEDNTIIQGEWRKFSSPNEEQKYRLTLDINDPNVREHLNEAYLFKSDIFHIEPISSEIWPSRFQQYIISFTPKEQGNFCETAYFTNIDLKEDKTNYDNFQLLKRVPITIKGTGLPPMAKFNVNQINVGHVMLDSFFEYSVNLENVGQVDLNFHLDPQQQPRASSSRSYSRMASNFKNSTSNSITFSPESGSIPANSVMPIIICLKANHVGHFKEIFTFSIDGVDTYKPQIIITGKVIGPSFKVDKHSIDFKNVSFGFLYTETFEIINESQIPFDFNLHFANDGSFEYREFNVIPSSCTIPKLGSQQVTVEFIPIRLQDYNVKLILDAPKFDDILFSMPISARCIVPDINIKESEIELGEIFIGHRFKSSVCLIDETDYPAKYEFIEPNDSSSLEAKIEIAKPRGIIPANKSEYCPFYITPLQLGHLKFVRYIRIYGSDSPSIPFTISALCIGPKIQLSTSELSFGQINVLEDVTKEIIIFNDSLIESHFIATFANDNNAFDVFPVESDILAGQKLSLRITANLNDIGIFKGRLILSFEHLKPMTVELKAKGYGSTLIPSIDMQKINFGYAFIGQSAICHFSLENRGRRNQEVRWSFPKSKNDEKQSIIKSIEPDQITIEKGEIAYFDLIVESSKAEYFSFDLLCHCILNRQRSEAYHPIVEGTFIKPLIELQQRNMTFKYIHDAFEEEKISGNISSSFSVSPSKSLLLPIIETNRIKNLSLLPISISTVCPKNFYISPTEFTIQPNESEYFEVTFDPSYKTNFSSEKFDTQIRFNFQNSPQFYDMKIHGEIIFPNLSFEPSTSIDFGILMTNTEDSRQIRALNTSPVQVDFYWELLTPKSDTQNGIEEARIFDIYPIRGSVGPGESIEMHVTFFAIQGYKENGCCHFSSTAICHVIGGPEYAIDLSGQSADIEYSLSTKLIDFGKADYSTHLHRTFSLENKSEVPINFKTKVKKNCGFKMLNISPKEGNVKSGETINFSLNLVCGVPKMIKTSFLIEINHFVDEQIDLMADCYFPQLHFTNLDRDENDPTTEYMTKKKKMMMNESENEEDEIDFDEAERNYLIEESLSHKKTMANSSSSPRSTALRSLTKMNSSKRFDGFVLSSFVADFGEIILGESKAIEYELTSLAPYSICFEIYSQNLDGTGFSISPTSFRDVPSNEKLKVAISFDTTKRTVNNNKLGFCSYKIPIVTKEDLGYLITIKASLSMPTLIISRSSFEFEPTICGQTRIQTFQIQNQNEIPCEFKIEQYQKMKNVFFTNPTNGILPPSSFINVDISFSPLAENEYKLQFPIKIKHNSNDFNVSVKGRGIQMKLLFEPSSINFPPIEEYSEPSRATVDVINTESYPIDVFSPQFDFELLLNALKNLSNQNQDLASNLRSSVSFSDLKQKKIHSQPKPSKFAVYIIVNGPPKSGRTTVSKALSAHMGNIPVISLNEVWSSLDFEVSTAEDYISAFRSFVEQKKYQRGFIIDGLDVFPETNESEAFLVHFLKQKNTQEELQKNPFTILAHSNNTSNEVALSYLLEALDGTNIYHVALNANENVLFQRQALVTSSSSRSEDNNNNSRAKRNKEEIDRLFNMNEDEYQLLTEEQQLEVDKKREYLRKYIMLNGDDLSGVILDGDLQTEKEKSEKANKKGKQKSNVPSNPYLLAVMLFQYTFGRICEKINLKCNFTPSELFTEKTNLAMSKSSTANTTAKTTATGNRSTKSSVKASKNNNKEKIDNALCESSISQGGNLLVDATLPIDSVLNEIFLFLPDIQSLKEKVLNQSIQQSRLILPDESAVGSPKLQDMPEQFRIVDDDSNFEIPDDLASFYPIYLKEKSCKVKKKLKNDNSAEITASVSKESINSQEEELTEDDDDDEFDLKCYTKRWHIDANSRITLNLEFNTKTIGSYESNLLFGICNCRNELFKLPVKGMVLRPDIDRNPKTIFNHVLSTPSAKATFSYIQSTGEYQFGPLLVSKDKINRNNSAIYKQDLNIVNISAFTINVNAYLAESGAKTVWTIENNNISINPHESGTVTIGFNPNNNDIYKNTLSIFIKGNPDPLIFPIIGEGCIPTIDISATNLDFEKLLLNQQRTMKLELANHGKIAAFWRIKNGSNLGNNLTITATEGLLKPSKATSIELTFTSPKPVVVKKSLQIEILDSNKLRTFSSNHVNITAESFDVSFDLTFPKGMTHINFGSVKVGQMKATSCFLRNQGRYPAKYKITVNGKSKASSVIKIDPREGTISTGEKGVTLNFTFTSNKPLKLSNSKGISLHVYDTNTGTSEETAVIPIPVSVESVYSKFAFEPENGQIEFGVVQMNTSFSKELKIINNGFYAFDFEIQPRLDITPPDPSLIDLGFGGRGRFKSQKKVNSNGGKQKKSNGKEFPIGPFVVTLSAGTVPPNSTVAVPINFNSGIDGQFDNSIVVKITDTDPSTPDSNGRLLRLTGSCAAPGILTSDFEKIFPGQHLCLRYDLAKAETMAFLEDEQVFHFTPLLLNDAKAVEVVLVNPFPIACSVDLSMKQSKSGASSQFPFELSEKSATIEANSKFVAILSFNPKSVGLFSGTFEAVVRGGTNPKTKALKFNVEGAGALPSITLFPQTEMTQTRSTIVNFGKILVDIKKEKAIGLKNDGLIPATVTIRANQKDDDFQLNLQDKENDELCTLKRTIKTLSNSNTIKSSLKRKQSAKTSKSNKSESESICHEFVLSPGCVKYLHVLYSPLFVRKGQFHITAELKDNSEKNISITYIGEGYSEDVIFESMVGDENNDVIFRGNVVGQRQQLSFMMNNVSADNVRFSWLNTSDFTFTPRVGHIKSHSKKEVTVYFQTEKPATYSNFSATCQWSKIEYKADDVPEWDDSMQQVSFVQRSSLLPSNTRSNSTARANFSSKSNAKQLRLNNNSNSNKNNVAKNGPGHPETSVVLVSPKGPEFDLIKVVEIKPEPLFEVVPGKRKDLVLKISAVSDYIKYEIDTTEIEFAPTMMYETRASSVTIKNACKIRFEYKWNTSLFGSLRTDYAQTMKSPFSVEPNEGFIEPGDSKSFNVLFSPKEVDDFTSHIICDVPLLTEKDKKPEIYVTGRSRRPICHFDLETSDYLTENRRHPDYTHKLPDGVKVMEILSKGVAEKVTKKFQIINTTEAPYEIIWSRFYNDDADQISCETQRVVISSGRRQTIIFSYTPNSAKTVESLWEFKIPEYGVTIPLLVVGRIIPY